MTLPEKYIERIKQAKKIADSNHKAVTTDIPPDEGVGVAFYDRIRRDYGSFVESDLFLNQHLEELQILHPTWKHVRTYNDHGAAKMSLYKLVEDARDGIFKIAIIRSVKCLERSITIHSLLSEMWDCGVRVYFATEGIWGHKPNGTISDVSLREAGCSVCS